MIQRGWAWLKSRFEPKPDPMLERWVRWYAQQIAEKISARRDKFDFRQALTELEADPSLDEFIADRTYRLFLRKAWRDGIVTAGEQQTLRWIASKVGISAERAYEIDQYTAELVFRGALTRALADGILDPEEVALLTNISQSAGFDLPAFTRRFLIKDGRLFLDDIAEIVAGTGTISDEQWARVTNIANSLGLSEKELLEAIHPQCDQLVDDIVQRIAADGTMSQEEMECIRSLVDRLQLGAAAQKRIARATRKLEYVKKLVEPTIADLANTLMKCGDREAIELDCDFEHFTHSVVPALIKTTWWEIAHARSVEYKYHAGAGRSVTRSQLQVLNGPPRKLRAQGTVVGLSGGFGSLYFFPIGVLVFRAQKFIGVDYSDIACSSVRCIEEESLPRDAEVVDHTWQFVNKDGGPDRRFKDNRQLPVCEYGRVELRRSNIELTASNRDVATLLV